MRERTLLILALAFSALLGPGNLVRAGSAPDQMVGIHSSRVMSQSLPWMAQEAGLFKKYNLDFNLVFISSSSIVTAALLGGDAEMTLTGGIGNVIAYVRGSTDVVFIGGVKNVMTQSLVAGGSIKKPEDLKGKRIAVSRIGGNTHYFTIQALRRHGLDPNRDFSFMQSGGDPEALVGEQPPGLLGGRMPFWAKDRLSDAELLATLGIDLDAVMARLKESFGWEAYYYAAQRVRLRPIQDRSSGMAASMASSRRQTPPQLPAAGPCRQRSRGSHRAMWVAPSSPGFSSLTRRQRTQFGPNSGAAIFRFT